MNLFLKNHKVNAASYAKVSKRLRQRVQRVCNDLNCEQKKIRFCITTMLPRTRRLLCVSLSPRTA